MKLQHHTKNIAPNDRPYFRFVGGCTIAVATLLVAFASVSGEERSRHSRQLVPIPDDEIPGTPLFGDEEPEEQPCDAWDGESVYCDWIMGTLVILGTPDSESIFIFHTFEEANPIGKILTEVIVTHSDGSEELFEFSVDDIVASVGDLGDEDVLPSDIYVDSGCGDDVVTNYTHFPITADLGSGNDRFTSYDGACTVDGGFGDDILFGSSETDVVNGGPGGDIISGGRPWPGVFTFGGGFNQAVFNLHPYGEIKDNCVDVLDCGPDGVIDVLLGETNSDFPIVTDELLRRDYNSPPGTDLINPF